MGGGDKSLRLLGGRPIIARVIERLTPQASGDPEELAKADALLKKEAR